MLKSRSDDFNHTPMSIISPLASSNQTMLDDCTIDLLPQDLTPFGHQRSSSLYLLVDKIQNDIAEHEQVVSKLLKSETEYEVMKSAFEQKLDLFKNQLVQVQRERDLALQRMGNDTLPKDKAGTIAVKARFDKKHKNLELEIQELKNKLLARNSNKVQNENLTKTLMSTIQSLKAEKALMTRKLKQEAEKNRELERAKERELERIRKIEKKSDDFVKINERNVNIKVFIINNSKELLNQKKLCKS